jgi:hypothetical protein
MSMALLDMLIGHDLSVLRIALLCDLRMKEGVECIFMQEVAEERESLEFMNQIRKAAGHRCGLLSTLPCDGKSPAL